MLAMKNHPNLLNAENTLIVVIDMQEPLLRNIYEADRVKQNVCGLMLGANSLRIPIIGTTQYAEKMGDILLMKITFFDPPKLSSSGFLRSEVSTKNTMALLPSFFIGSDGPIKKNL